MLKAWIEKAVKFSCSLITLLYINTQKFIPSKLKHYANLLLATAAVFFRFGSGAYIPKGVRVRKPERPLELYEFEGCPFCRRVREALAMLDLNVIIYPCPRTTLKQYGVVANSRFRPKAVEIGERAQFPLLVDPNTQSNLYESADIINYLFLTYGDAPEEKASSVIPWTVKKGLISDSLLFIGALLRPIPFMGVLQCPSKQPEQLLILYSNEANPHSRIVKEALCCLEIPYTLHNVPFFSPKREQLRKQFNGTLKLPLLVDPNTGFQSNSSFDIQNYLYKTYQTGAAQYQTYYF